ncbi:IS3 family transposase [Actinomyces bowdenii]|uniref:IS3 family transposase n=1 Tax=Actinomyces bowdenii TaxID=131109 RepID=UPI0034D25E80
MSLIARKTTTQSPRCATGRGSRGRATCSWRDRPQSRRDIRRKKLVSIIDTEFKASDGTYGYRRITARLTHRGVVEHRDRCATSCAFSRTAPGPPWSRRP